MRRSVWAPLAVSLALLGLAVSVFFPRRGRSSAEAIAEGQDWLLRHQQPDGLWHARMEDPCHVPTVFEVDEALSGLAVVALEGNDRAASARERGVHALHAAQHPDGSFGPEGVPKRRFNWILPTWALVRLAPSEEGTRRALRRIGAECRSEDLEDCEGGWSLLVFRDARAQGLPVDPFDEEGAKAAIRRSLERHANTTAVVPAMAALFLGGEAGHIADSTDLHLLFFAVPAGSINSSLARKYLLASQSRSGCARGSWDPDRWWGTAGGRVYSTCMGVLILKGAGDK